jgi:3'-phosphoadenosine 5'-phosphosulfate sulfotransferase (PAPS reductase)/FAD synthetase
LDRGKRFYGCAGFNKRDIRQVPMPVVFVDTSAHFSETYQFRDRMAKDRNLSLVIARNDSALKKIKIARDKEKCCHLLKTTATQNAIKQNKWKALIVGIRWDEQEARANEDYVSKRKKS